MSKHERRRPSANNQPVSNPPAAPAPDAPAQGSGFQGPLTFLVCGVVAGALLIGAYKWWTSPAVGDPTAPIAKNRPTVEDPPEPDPGDFHQPKSKTKPVDKEEPDFLGEFNKKDGEIDKESGGEAVANSELEKLFQALVEVNDQLNDLQKRASAIRGASIPKELENMRDRLVEQYNREAAALEKEVGEARKARPADPVPRWLTGELLLLIRADPESILPHLQYALTHGLRQPRVLGSMARTHLAANQFAESYRNAAEALERRGKDRYLWQAFAEAAVSPEQFGAVVNRLDQAFPVRLPDWAIPLRHNAERLQTLWENEQKLRSAEARADDLPRVKLVIEHRRFARDASGKPLTTIENTGREIVILELFENEASDTVANFIDLVTRKFYDGTTFHRAVPAHWVAGGDPNTKKGDPSQYGLGGPGYVIADEFKSPKARNHFRGSVSMVNFGRPHTAGSQFYLCLTPGPEMNGNFTVFGRIVEGQEAVDRITSGQTYRDKNDFGGKLIPGDLLVSAEVLRKRPHEYRAVKAP